MVLNRRRFLTQALLKSGGLGCSLAASPLVAPVSFAAAPWDHRLVVIILRGGLDGLDLVRPMGDPQFAALRPNLAEVKAARGTDLDGFYTLHPALSPLMPLWRSGDLGFVHAVSTPYRDKRSHFDGQDLLEAGTLTLQGARDGWLNRVLQAVPGIEGETAYGLGHGAVKVLAGAAPIANWHPKANLHISPQTEQLLMHVMEGDPLFEAALNDAITLSEDRTDPFFDPVADSGVAKGPLRVPQDGPVALAAYAADRLRGDTRIAAFSMNGWDTHARQQDHLGRRLSVFADVILTLQARLGARVWEKTAVVAMTEFGRTARENGSEGTDHGTGGAMLLAGGAVRGGRVFGTWPGLAEADLYDRRDLMPTGDVRAAAAWILRGIAPLSRSELETKVFPGLDMGQDSGLLA